jgi:hypothetical protein
MMSGKEFDGTSDLKRGEGDLNKTVHLNKTGFSPTKFRFGRIKTRLEEPPKYAFKKFVMKVLPMYCWGKKAFFFYTTSFFSSTYDDDKLITR